MSSRSLGSKKGNCRGEAGEVVDRKNSNSMKCAYAEKLLAPDEASADPLPMWVADTDFKKPQAVIDALHSAVDHNLEMANQFEKGAVRRVTDQTGDGPSKPVDAGSPRDAGIADAQD